MRLLQCNDTTKHGQLRTTGILKRRIYRIREWTRFPNQDVAATSVTRVTGKAARWRHSQYIGLVSLCVSWLLADVIMN